MAKSWESTKDGTLGQASSWWSRTSKLDREAERDSGCCNYTGTKGREVFKEVEVTRVGAWILLVSFCCESDWQIATHLLHPAEPLPPWNPPRLSASPYSSHSPSALHQSCPLGKTSIVVGCFCLCFWGLNLGEVWNAEHSECCFQIACQETQLRWSMSLCTRPS